MECYLYRKICIYLYCTYICISLSSVQINKYILWDTLRVAETVLVSGTSQRTKPSWRCCGKQQDCLHLHRTGWWPDCPERHKMLTMLDPFPAPHLGMKVLNWCMFLILWLKPSPSECSFHGFTGKSFIASIDIWVSRRHLVACVLGLVLRLWWRRDCRVAFVKRDQGKPHAGHRQL